MGGKTGTTTSQVSIPPDVLARYNSVNAQAQQVASTPFQPYTGQFVSGLTPTQQAGIQGTSQYSQAAQPYYEAATSQLMGAQQSALPGISAAYQNVGQAQNVGQQYGETAAQYYGGAANAAMPYYGAMEQGIGGALSYAQPLNAAAQQAATSATGAATPYYQAATQGTAEAVAAAQPYQEAARQGLGAALQYSGGINQAAPQLAYSSYGAAQPIMGQALSGTQAAQQAGAPYQQASTQAALSGAQGVNPEALNIGAYMSPYTQSVADATFQALRQQQQQEMAGQTANAIRSGAFGGDRAALAAANLSRQQQLATAQAMAPIYQQGFGQALAAAQQQQGVGLSAAQANRAAMQNLAAQLQGIGQQGYAQQLGAAGQIGQLGQNIYGQGLGTAQALSQMGQTGFGQQLQAAQAQAALGQQAYGQQLGAAQQFGNLGQNIYGMGANQANLLSQLGQTGYGQQLGAAQQLGNIGQNLYTMGLGTGQAVQGLGQQQFGQGMGAAQQLAGLAQQGYGMGSATSQALAGLGTQAQQAGLQGAQAQIGAGTLEQQTQQADLTARYQQFLQERGYPFQVAQFLANIAMGTGALSGSTTTTTQPMPFFSDRRVKHDVKEIGKTHDGQPIYSFKYNGHNDTQIGLMAQDVEKKHPEAVGEYGGVKTVDYKKATEGAERKERYEGGLVPASQGGAVTEPGAYGRGGYKIGGDIADPNDISSILAMQKEALGPFSQMGLYGQGHAEGQPFGQSGGIVPQKRLHVASLKPAEHRTQQLQGLGGQALEAYDTGKKLYGGYQEAKDIGAKLADMFADPTNAPSEMGPLVEGASWPMNRGGVVPRKHFVAGGTAFSDPYKPYEIGEGQVPEEVLDIEDKPELAKAPTPSPSSGGGSGLGTALALGKFALGFFKDGGSIPRGHLQTGGVYDPTLGRIVSDEMSPIEELNKEDVYSRELNPAAAPRFRVFERIAAEEGAKGVKPTELYRSPERSAMLDLTMPEGAPRAKPYQSGHNYGLAVDYSGTTPENYEPIRKAAAATGLTSGLDFRNVDPPHVQLGKGGYGGLYGKNVNVDEGFGQRSQSGAVPADAQEAAYAKAREVISSKGVNPELEQGQGMMDNLMGYMRRNQEWLVPAGSFLRGMVQSKSPFLGAAVLEGLGSGMEAVGTAQQQIANLNLARAQAMRQSLGLVSERFKMLPNGNYFDTVEQREISAEQRNQIMRSLGLPVGPTSDVAGKTKEVLEKSGIPSPVGQPAATTVEPTPQPAAAAPTTEQKPAPATEAPKQQMSDKYPDIPIVTSQTTEISQRILAQAEQNPDVQSWKQRVSEYQSRADQAQKNADALRGRGDNAQAETYQKQADELRASAAQAQEQMLLTRDKVAAPEMAKLQGQTRVGQEADALTLKQAREAAPQLRRANYRLAEMRHNFEKLPSSGWLATGKFGEQKAEFAKSINDFANTFGAEQPFDVAQVAAAAAIQKDSVRLGEELAKSLGNNNAAAIINQSVAATPSLATPELGWKLLLGSLDQANEYMKKEASYMERYWEVNQTLQGAQDAFAKAYPVENFVNAAMVSIVPPADADALKAAVGTPNEKAAKERIDKKYGRGTAKILLGG